MSWVPVTEAQLHDGWMEIQRETLDAWRREMRADGWPACVVERMAKVAMDLSAANLERAKPLILRDLAVTGGATTMQ